MRARTILMLAGVMLVALIVSACVAPPVGTEGGEEEDGKGSEDHEAYAVEGQLESAAEGAFS